MRLNKRLPDEVLLSVLNLDEIGRMADSISAYILGKVPLKQELLEEPSLAKRMARINQILADELEILEIEQRIDSEVQSQVQKNQREFYLNEQLRAIRKELGYTADEDTEVEEYVRAARGERPDPGGARGRPARDGAPGAHAGLSPEATVVRNYLDTLLALPWKKRSRDRIDTRKVRERLDADHYGLEKVKDRIVEFLAVYKLTHKLQGTILCLVGPPGVGKTSLGRSIADSMNEVRAHQPRRRARRGGDPRAPAHLHRQQARPHHRVAAQGRHARTRSSCSTRSTRWAPTSAAIPPRRCSRCSTPSRTRHFSDHYLEVDFDLSEVMFITTANSLHSIPPALEDRMEIIRLPGYLEHEKRTIAERFLVPRQMKRNGVGALAGRLQPRGVPGDHRRLHARGRRAQSRARDRRSAARWPSTTPRRASGPPPVTARPSRYLGMPKFRRRVVDRQPEIGVVVGLAWTMAGGEILEIESSSVPGAGKITITGNLKDVMKESAETALSYARGLCRDMSGEWFKNNQIHIHVPGGRHPEGRPQRGHRHGHGHRPCSRGRRCARTWR